MRILLVEDDSQLGSGMRSALEKIDYTVDWLTDGLSARSALMTESFDLMVLDLGLPLLSGINLLKEIREQGNKIPVLILSAHDTAADRVVGLDCGADDYMIKPFDLDEFYARIRALLRRKVDRASPEITYGSIILDPAARTITLDDKPVFLPSKEFAILYLLLENSGRVMSREQIEEKLYSWNDAVESNATEVHIHHIRKKLGKELIVTVRGVGYMVPKNNS